jgi:glycosyltransferase involved in cell wall biosynthesis
MATRLPIVATAVGGNAELIESGMSGTLVPAADPEALARAIIAYFAERTVARRHAEAAYQVALTRFNLATMVEAYASIYEQALAGAGFPLPPSTSRPGAPPTSVPTRRLHSVSNP